MTARQWLEKAKREHFAIGAFNVGNLETFKAIAMAAKNKKSPVIVESSPGETDWMGADNVVDIARNLEWDYGIPIFVNLDHSTELEDCEEAIRQGYDLIHFDGSKLPLAQNLEILKKVVELAHTKHLIVEGELDHIGGSSEVHEGAPTTEIAKTDPERARTFVQNSGIDIFAAFVGNIHGLYEGGTKQLDIDLVGEIAAATGIFLSLHGSSGIPENQVAQAIQNGIVKVNLNTEIRQVYKDTLEKILQENPDEYAMYKVEGPVLEEIQKLVEHKIELFGSSGKV